MIVMSAIPLAYNRRFTMARADGARIDWVTLFWARVSEPEDAENGIQEVLGLARLCTKRGWRYGGFKYKLSSGKTGKDAYHKVEIWGEAADEFASYLSPGMWYRVSRLDWRLPLAAKSDVEMKQFVLAAQRKGAKRVNLTPFHTEPRMKNEKRDVGGDGICYGSRKTDQHFVIYKRGRELPAWEYRLANQTCRAQVEKIVRQHYADPFNAEAIIHDVYRMLDAWAEERVHTVLGTRNVQAYVDECIKDESEAQEIVEATRAVCNREDVQMKFWKDLAYYAPNDRGAFDLLCRGGCGNKAGPDGGPCSECDPNPIIP